MKAQHMAAGPDPHAPEPEPAGQSFSDFEALLNTMPHPVLVLGPENEVVCANFPAEVFFDASETVLRRRTADDLVAFSCPLLALIRQVRQTHTTVNEYGVELTMPDGGRDRVADVFAAPLLDHDGLVMVMLQQRTMAQMIERQLTHRGAARSVSGLAAVLAHEIKNPLSGIRGAAQLLESGAQPEDQALAQLICDETERIRSLVERMEVAGDGEDRQSERREVAREFIRRFKIDQSLYQKYGGRVIFQQMGPEPIDAYREFLEDRQEAGAFRILDRDLADGFWEYLTNDSIHSFYPPEEAERFMSRPWWERDPAEANDPE